MPQAASPVGPQSLDAASGWTSVGYVVKPHGVRGELRLNTDIAWDTLQGDVTQVRITPREGGAASVMAVRARSVHRGVLITLEGVDNPEAAARLRGAGVEVRDCHIPPCDEGEFYLTELQGATVSDPDGTKLGVMQQVLDNAGQALGVIVTDDGVERLLPLVPQTIQRFERAQKQLHVRVPPGLWDA